MCQPQENKKAIDVYHLSELQLVSYVLARLACFIHLFLLFGLCLFSYSVTFFFLSFVDNLIFDRYIKTSVI